MTVPDRRTGPEYVALADEVIERAGAGRVAMAATIVEPTALILGSAQRDEEADPAACAQAGVAVVRRGTGGGAVLCDAGVLLIDIAVPRGHPLGIDDVTEAYRPLGEAIATGLGEVGVETRLVSVHDARASDEARRAAARRACWAGLSPYELVLPDGRKLVGLAQRRRAGAVLHQVAIHVSSPPVGVTDLLAGGADLLPWLEPTACVHDVVDVTVDEVWGAVGGRLADISGPGQECPQSGNDPSQPSRKG